MDILEFFWDLNQHNRIRRSEDDIAAAGATLDSLRSRLTLALERLDHTNLVLLALWELVGERLGLTAEQLRARVAEIDLRDGVKDGRYTGAASRCEGCGREMPSWRKRCMYCGHGPAAADLSAALKSGGSPPG